jgi:hypothetical protein
VRQPDGELALHADEVNERNIAHVHVLGGPAAGRNA